MRGAEPCGARRTVAVRLITVEPIVRVSPRGMLRVTAGSTLRVAGGSPVVAQAISAPAAIAKTATSLQVRTFIAVDLFKRIAVYIPDARHLGTSRLLARYGMVNPLSAGIMQR